MLRETLGLKLAKPMEFHTYENPMVVELQYVEIWKDPFPEPWEAEVQFDLGAEQKFAFTRLNLIDEENRTARAALLGERNGDVLVAFPPTNFGETKFYANSDDLLKIIRLPDAEQK